MRKLFYPFIALLLFWPQYKGVGNTSVIKTDKQKYSELLEENYVSLDVICRLTDTLENNIKIIRNEK